MYRLHFESCMFCGYDELYWFIQVWISENPKFSPAKETCKLPVIILIASFQPLFIELMLQLCANIPLLLRECRGTKISLTYTCRCIWSWLFFKWTMLHPMNCPWTILVWMSDTLLAKLHAYTYVQASMCSTVYFVLHGNMLSTCTSWMPLCLPCSTQCILIHSGYCIVSF